MNTYITFATNKPCNNSNDLNYENDNQYIERQLISLLTKWFVLCKYDGLYDFLWKVTLDVINVTYILIISTRIYLL